MKKLLFLLLLIAGTLSAQTVDPYALTKVTAQNEILLYGGTDTSVLQAAGVGAYAGCISIPSRYIHSGVEMIDLRDVDACTDLATAFALDPTL